VRYRKAATHGVEGETILSLVSRIANGKVETEGERDRGNACDLVCCGVTGREKIRPFLKRGLERIPEELVINVGILDRVIRKLWNVHPL